MIHNPEVNRDLQDRGVKFLMTTSGDQLIDWSELNSSDIVIIPAFGTTLEIQKQLNELGIDPYKYNTTCPFVEKVWNRSAQLGGSNYTVIIHGKHYHEETRATFSHSIENSSTLIVKDLKEAEKVGEMILGNISSAEFYGIFEGKYSEGFIKYKLTRYNDENIIIEKKNFNNPSSDDNETNISAINNAINELSE